MTQDPYACRVGVLMTNFQSLEFILRAFLHELPTEPPTGIPYGTDIYTLPVGTELPENALTNYDSLRDLIKKFNSEMKKRDLAEIDDTLVEIRDALAHGRISAPGPTAETRLIKFSKPRDGRVRVQFNQTMSLAWFQKETKRVHDAILAIHRNLKP